MEDHTEVESSDINTTSPVTVEFETSERSGEFVGRWHKLVSTTNWEKGRIILEWREALIADEASATTYSDEAWSQIVGAVTPQHVGRLRRVYERFQNAYGDYKGLYWSHFHAAIDWEDAEMWLEGGVQNGWSVSQMRKKRWETLGEIPDQQPADEQVVTGEVDEDVVIDGDQPSSSSTLASSFEAVENVDKRTDSPEANPSKPTDDAHDENEEDAFDEEADSQPEALLTRPFAELPELPADVMEAFEAYKLVILRHKLNDWEDISRDDMLLTLDSLKQLAVATSE